MDANDLDNLLNDINETISGHRHLRGRPAHFLNPSSSFQDFPVVSEQATESESLRGNPDDDGYQIDVEINSAQWMSSPRSRATVTSTHSSDGSQANSNMTSTNSEQGTALTSIIPPSIVIATTFLLHCPFWFLDCYREGFADLQECFMHSLMHFLDPRGMGFDPRRFHTLVAHREFNQQMLQHLPRPPDEVHCPFRRCAWVAYRPDFEQGLPWEVEWTHWLDRLDHIEAVHLRNGQSLSNGEPEYHLVQFLHANDRITRIQYRDLYEDWFMTRPAVSLPNVGFHGGASEDRIRRRQNKDMRVVVPN